MCDTRARERFTHSGSPWCCQLNEQLKYAYLRFDFRKDLNCSACANIPGRNSYMVFVNLILLEELDRSGLFLL